MKTHSNKIIDNTTFKWLSRFAIVRGIVGTLSLLTLLASILDLRAAEFAKVIFAIFRRWEKITTALADLLNAIPYLPAFSGYTLNAIVFCSVVSVPSAIGLYDLYLVNDKNKYRALVTKLASLILSFLAPFFAFTVILNPAELANSELSQTDAIVLGTSFIAIPLVGALIVREFRIGMLYLIGFLVGIQILYYAPILGDFLKSWSSGVL